MGSNTAERWWVRTAARWLARIDGVSAQLRLAMLGLTGVSTATITLKQYGHGDLAWPFIAVVAVGTVGYAYVFGEGGVWNQVSRDRADMSDNYSGPTMRIDDELIGSAVFAAVHGRPPDEDEQQSIAAAVDRPWREYRDGIDIEEAEA